MNFESLIQNTVALLAIVNPVGPIPVFLGLTRDITPGARRAAALRVGIAVALILAISAIAGGPLLRTFGISMPALQAVGGLAIVLMGLEMMRGTPTRFKQDRGSVEEAESAEDQLMVPLAMPLLAGPGAITTAITLSAREMHWQDKVSTMVAVAVVGLVVFLAMASAGWIGGHVGPRGQRIFLRFMGLILGAIGAQVMLTGLTTFGK